MSESELYSLAGKKNIGICLGREISPNKYPSVQSSTVIHPEKLIASLLG